MGSLAINGLLSMKPANRTGNREPEPSGTEPSEPGSGPEPPGTGTARNRNRPEPEPPGTARNRNRGLYGVWALVWAPGWLWARNRPEPEPSGTGTVRNRNRPEPVLKPNRRNRTVPPANRTEPNRTVGFMEIVPAFLTDLQITAKCETKAHPEGGAFPGFFVGLRRI